ncbi:MAG TPA: PQQ-binding-like beta-propeller repeat protein [Bryobacteraceae bacterium]|nr:PQQ-binding-like beta-propeller repeat protein [Bryobacteraceae bacterium]
MCLRLSVRRVACLVAALATLPVLHLFAADKTASKENAAHNTDWATYNGSPGNSHYSSLKQINVNNVARLKPVWSFDTHETGGLETEPLIVSGVVYAYTPHQKVIALNATTGKLLWAFDSGVGLKKPDRAVAYWTDGKDKRILAGISHFLYALNAETGKPIPSFGKEGRIDLRENLGRDPEGLSVSVTSPGAIYKDLIIMGDATPESLPAPPGDIRAYDIRTGKMRWIFHTIPHPGEYGYDTWPKDAWKTSGSANNWCGMAVDTERGIVYVPTGSAATDWYGADRVGDDLFANSLIALNAETGKRIWHFQAVHHDLWDRDLPSPPTLVTVVRNHKEVPAVAQTSKMGYLYLFNRVDGSPLFPMETKRYPASTVPGEVAAPEQTLPTRPAPFARQRITEDMVTNRTPASHEWALNRLRSFISEGQFVPNSAGKDTLMFPGWDGGAEWGGSAFDPDTHILYLNANDVGLTESLVKHEPSAGGSSVYQSQCAACHGANRQGQPPSVPSLDKLQEKYTVRQVEDIVQSGRGRMPAFPGMTPADRRAVASFVINGGSGGEREEPTNGKVTYDTTGYHKFLDPDGYPAVKTPWGTLNAINLDTGDYVWKIPFGEYPELVAKGLGTTGSENYGGPVVTAGGVVFIAATVIDKKIRAYDKKTGKLLWEYLLPYPANATPAVYEIDGREYLIIGAGGGREPKLPTGGVYVAFALPE